MLAAQVLALAVVLECGGEEGAGPEEHQRCLARAVGYHGWVWRG